MKSAFKIESYSHIGNNLISGGSEGCFRKNIVVYLSGGISVASMCMVPYTLPLKWLKFWAKCPWMKGHTKLLGIQATTKRIHGSTYEVSRDRFGDYK